MMERSMADDLKQRAQDLAAKLIETLNDPDAARERAAFDEVKERDDVRATLAYQLSAPLAAPVVPDHPVVAIRDVAALRAYIDRRGIAYRPTTDGAVIYLQPTRVSTYEVAIRWLADAGQVRFTVAIALEPPPTQTQLSLLSWAVHRINDQLGVALWRLDPALTLAIGAYLDHDGALSSRAVERALAQLKLSLSRDLATLKTVMRTA
jgi:hypothetical protein